MPAAGAVRGIATKVFANASITVTPVTLEADVKAVLTKVTLGEVDAGIVYVTDVSSAGARSRGSRSRPASNASTTYPIATVRSSTNPALAAAFVAYVLSPDGAMRADRRRLRQILTADATGLSMTAGSQLTAAQRRVLHRRRSAAGCPGCS